MRRPSSRTNGSLRAPALMKEAAASRRSASRCRLEIEGELDGCRADELLRACRQALRGGTRDLILDSSLATGLTSSGVGVLVRMWQEMTRHGGRIAMIELSPALRVIVELTRLERVLEVHDSLESLERAWARPSSGESR
ncbi:MAG: STAS domain-containing protein [Planctomycetota bacterium]